MRKKEVEDALEGKGDFVKIDYLMKYLKKTPPLEMRKFAYLKLAEIYLHKEMFIDAARMYRNIAVNSPIFREKKENYLKESKAYILAGKFENSDKSLRRAIDEGNSIEKKESYKTITDFYIQEGERLEKDNKPGQTMKLYEKLIRMKLNDEEKENIREKLLTLYEKLGKREEYNFLKTK